MKRAEELRELAQEREPGRAQDMLPAAFRLARKVSGVPLMVAVAPLAAYSASRAQRGEKLAAAVGTGTFAALMPTLATTFVAVGANPLLAPLAALYPAFQLSGMASRAYRKFSSTARSIRQLEMGGNYRDSYSAYATRMQAMQEITGTHQAARRWLGQEGRMLHR